jgi:hypothetical protein
MKKTTLAMMASLALLAPTLVLAQNAPNSEPAPTVQPESTADGHRLICKYYSDNGRVLPRRDCRTADQWERIRYERQRELVNIQMQGDIQR